MSARNLHQLSDLPYEQMGHADAVNHCLMVVLTHGYTVTMVSPSKKVPICVTFDEKERAIEYTVPSAQPVAEQTG
jgi:hypothetical protein